MLKRLKGKLSDAVRKTNKRAAILLASSFVVASCTGFAYAGPNLVTITDTDAAPIQIRTTETNVASILAKQGITVGANDSINYAPTDNITGDAIISIVRSYSVNITYKGETKEYMTTQKYVDEILNEQGIKIGDNDVVTPSLDSELEEGGTIVVTTYNSHNVTVQEVVPYTTREVENTSLGEGERVVVQEGKNGVNEYVYDISYENDVEVSRTLVRDAILSNPVEEIIEYGPESVWKLGVVPASAPTNYKKVEVFTATAYDASPADNGPWAGQTSTGMPLVYGVVAVDPRVIPYGTKMYIESVDGQYKYGYAIAGDCGGAIKGNKVDLFFESRSTCYNFGRRPVKIYFLD